MYKLPFEERIKLLRLNRRLTMQEVATKIGLAKSSYAGYEGGYRHPPMNKLIALAQLYQVSTDYLLGLTDNTDSNQTTNVNAKDFLEKKFIHWDGVLLSEAEQSVVKQLLEVVIQRKETSEKMRRTSKEA